MKQKIRQDILHQRNSLSSKAIKTKSNIIFQKLKKCPLYQKSDYIMIYVDFRNEVKTNNIINDLLAKNKKVIIPISVPKTKEMILSQLLDPQKELEKGTFGVLEPKKKYIRKVVPEVLDLIIVPGVAFDLKGYRIGYGGGYYDRFFEKLSKPIPSIALAFELQIVPTIPIEPFDQSVDFVITENRIITCK